MAPPRPPGSATGSCATTMQTRTMKTGMTSHGNSYVVSGAGDDPGGGGTFSSSTSVAGDNTWLGRTMYAFADPWDTPDERVAKALLTALTSVTVVAASLWGVLFAAAFDDLASASVCWSFAGVAGLALAHLGWTHSMTLAAPVFVIGIATGPVLIMFTRGGIITSRAVVLWALLSPVAGLTIMSARGLAWGLHGLVCATIVLVGVMDTVVGGGGWNALGVSNTDSDDAVRHISFTMNIVVAGTFVFFAMEHFWSRWRAERDRFRAMLRQAFPQDVLNEMETLSRPPAYRHEGICVMFVDIVNFTQWTATTPPSMMLAALTDFMSRAHTLARRHGVERIKIIGDAMLLIAGRPAAEESFRRSWLEMRGLSISDGGKGKKGDAGGSNSGSKVFPTSALAAARGTSSSSGLWGGDAEPGAVDDVDNDNDNDDGGGGGNAGIDSNTPPPDDTCTHPNRGDQRAADAQSVSSSRLLPFHGQPGQPRERVQRTLHKRLNSRAAESDRIAAAAVAAGCPSPAHRMAAFALALRDTVAERSFEGECFEIRMGVDVGDVIAGVIGASPVNDAAAAAGDAGDARFRNHAPSILSASETFCEPWALPESAVLDKDGAQVIGAFDVMGDTINRAARIESAGAPMRLLASERFAKALAKSGAVGYVTESRGHIAAKGIEGGIPTVWVEKGRATRV